jgi:homoaconitase/3-isopropylmalate dehydratase large subunit
MIVDKLDMTGDIQFDRVHRLNASPTSPVIACCTFYKDKEKILKAKRKLKGTQLFIGEDFSYRVRDIRRKLSSHLKIARSEGKRAIMVFDHLLVDGKKFYLGEGETLRERE